MNQPDGKKSRSVIRKRNQITLGKEVLDSIGLSERDAIEFIVCNGVLIGIPYEMKPKSDQSGHWTEEWQAVERLVDEWLDQGELENSPTYTADEFLSEMKRRSK